MRKSLGGLALVAGLAVAATSVAQAQFSWGGCGGAGSPGFNTCASVLITWNSGTNQLTMVVDNWGTFNNFGPQPTLAGSSVFTDIGLLNGSFGSGALTSLTSFACGGGGAQADPSCTWVFGANGLGAQYAGNGAKPTPPPSSNGLNPPSPSGAGNFTRVTLVFSTTGTIDLSGTTWGVHGQVGPINPATGGNCSTKLFVQRTGPTTYVTNSTTTTTCQTFNPPTETPVPEPASLILLATGLVAMGGVGVIRRRRNRKV